MDFLLSQSPLELNEEQVFAIWDATVVQALTLSSRDIAYDVSHVHEVCGEGTVWFLNG